MYDRHCRQCGLFVGKTDETGLCEKCRRVYEDAKLVEDAKKPFKLRIGSYIP